MAHTHYPGVVNSPVAYLTGNFTVGDTVIAVNHLEVAYFPAAPNIAVMGDGDDAVTYLYTGKSGSSGAGNLTGVSVLEGTAKNWTAGTPIGRNMTNYDLHAIQEDMVAGPASATNENIAVYDGTTGKLVKDGGATVASLAPKASPTFTGTATIPVIDLTGGQIKFPATQAASSDANTFDDYEEGTWTPDLKFGANTAGTQSNIGYYLKAAGLMAIVGTVTLTSKGANTGDATITGLPFSITGSGVGVSIRTDRITFVNVPQAHVTVALATTIQLSEAPDGGGAATNLTDADFVNNSSIRFSFIARVV